MSEWEGLLRGWMQQSVGDMNTGLQSNKALSLASLGSGNLAINGSLKIRSKPKRIKPRGTWKKLRRCKCRNRP